MSKKSKRKKESVPTQDTTLPYEKYAAVMAILVIVGVLFAFYSPVVFQGQTSLAPDKLAAYSNRTLIHSSLDEPGGLVKTYPLWSPYVFSGMPSMGSMMTAPYTNAASMVFGFAPWRIRLVLFYCLTGIFTWLLLRRHGLGHLPALFGGLSFVFCTHVITLFMFGHSSKIVTLMYWPVILAAVFLLWKRWSLLWAALLALAVAWMLLAHHVQVSYYVLMGTGIFMIVSTVASLRSGESPGQVAGKWARIVAPMAVGLMTSMLLYLPVKEYAAYSIRGATGGGLTYEYATSWSLHPLEMINFLIPSFMGYGGATYWGFMPFTDFPLYMGILPLFLAVVTLVFWPRERFHVFLWITAAFALLAAFGRHVPVVYNLLFNFLPFFNKFRVPVMITFLLQFSVAILAAIALDRLMRQVWDPAARKKLLMVVAGFLVVFVFLGILSSGPLQSTIEGRLMERPTLVQQVPANQLPAYAQQLAQESVSKARGDFLRVLVFLVLGLGLIVGRVRGTINNTVLGLGLLAITVIDLWAINTQPASYRSVSDLTAKFRPTPTVEFLTQQKEQTQPFRILPIVYPDGNPNFYAYFEISSINGYHPAKLKLYQDIIDDQGPVGIFRQMQRNNFNVIDMLGTRYIICDDRSSQALLRINPDRFRAFQSGSNTILENREALDRLWFVERYSVTPEENLHLGRLSDLAWDPKREAILFEDIGSIDPPRSSRGTITEYRPREIRAKLQSAGNCLMMMGEVYYPKGWKFTLNGEPLESYRANYGIRAFRIPPGEHEFVARFDPQSFTMGVWMGGVGYGLIFAGLVVGAIGARRGARRGEEP